MKQQKEQKLKGKSTQKARAKQVGIAATSIIALSTASSIAAIALNEKPNSSTPQNNSVVAKRNNVGTTTPQAANSVKSTDPNAPRGFLATIWPHINVQGANANDAFLQEADRRYDDLVKGFSRTTASGDTSYFQLIMTSGFQDDETDRFCSNLANAYNATKPQTTHDKDFFKNLFKFYYTIGDDTTENEIRVGTNRWDVRNIVKNGKIQDINIYAKIDGTGIDWIDNTGYKYVIKGGDNPSPVLHTLNDIGTYVPSLAGLSSDVGLFGSFATTDSGHNFNKATKFSDYILAPQIDKLAFTSTFSGTAKQLTVNLNTNTLKFSDRDASIFLNGGITGSSSTLGDNVDKSDLYLNTLPINFYYSVGDSRNIITPAGTTFQIDLTNAIDYSDPKNPKLPKIYFYYAANYLDNISKGPLYGAPDQTRGGSDAGKHKFKFVGERVEIDPNGQRFYDHFTNVTDIIKTVEAPVPVDDALATRSVTETNQKGILHPEDLLEYTYRIGGGVNQGDTGWLTKDNFFGTNKPGSTSEAVAKGVEWRATRKPIAAFDANVQLPAGTKLQSFSSVTGGEIKFNVPTVSKIDAPTISATNSLDWKITAANRSGIDYVFTLPNDLKWPNGKNTATADEIDKWQSNNNQFDKNLYNLSKGKFNEIKWVGTAVNKSSSAKNANGTLKLTNDDKPSATVRGIIEKMDDKLKPTIDQSSENTSKLKVKLSSENPLVWHYTLNGKQLKLDNNNILVDSSGGKVNTWTSSTSSSRIGFELDKNQATKSNSYVEYRGASDITGQMSTYSVKNYIDKLTGLPTVDGNSITFDIHTNNFPVNLEYSIDGKKWMSESELLQTIPDPAHSDNLFYSSNFNGTRNLYDKKTSNFLNLQYRTAGTTFVIDKQVAADNHLTEDPSRPGMYIGKFDTSNLKIALETTPLNDSKNIPVLTGTNASDYSITVPTLANVTYQFRLKGEGDHWLDAATFKSTHKNISTTQSGKTVVQDIEWRALADPAYMFVKTSSSVPNLTDSNGIFQPKVLVPQQQLAAIVTHVIAAPKLMGTDSQGNKNPNATLTTANIAFDKLALTNDPAMRYQYKIGDKDNWHEMSEKLDGAKLVNATKDGLLTLHWQVVFDTPDINKADPNTPDHGDVSTAGILIAINEKDILNLPLTIFGGSDSMNWTFDDKNTRLSQPGIKFTFSIPGITSQAGGGTSNKQLSIAELQQQAGKINLFDQTKDEFVSITVTGDVSDIKKYVIVGGSGVWTQTLKATNLKKFIENVGTPTIDGPTSIDYDIHENALANQNKQVIIKYSTDQSNWESEDKFKDTFKNLFDEVSNNNSLYKVYWKAFPINNQTVIDPNITVKEITLPTNMKIMTGKVGTPSVIGATTTDYTLPDKIEHMTYKYRLAGTTDAPVDAADFKKAHPNIFKLSEGKTSSIIWQATPEPGYGISGGAIITGNVLKTDDLKKIVPVSEISTPTTKTTTPGTTKTFDLDVKYDNVIDYRYSTNGTADTSTFVSLSTLMTNEHGNLYDSSTGSTKKLYFIPAVKDPIHSALDSTATPKEVNIDALKKAIADFNVPKITSDTNSSNAYKLDLVPTPNVKYSYSTNLTNTWTDKFQDILDTVKNLYNGSDLKGDPNATGFITFAWKVEALDDKYVIEKSIQSDSFLQDISNFKKVITDSKWVDAPEYKGGGISAYTFDEPSHTGLTYKYYVGSDASQAKEFAAFKTATGSLWDSANNQPKEVHWIVSPTLGAVSPNIYVIPTPISGIVDLDTLKNQVISDVITPVLDAATKDSHDFIINIDNRPAVKTEFSLGTKTGMTYAELLDEIKNNHGNNLWDEANNTFLDISWKVSPANTGQELETGTVDSGKLDYNVGGNLIKKFVTASAPTVTATSTRLQDLSISNENPNFEFTYGLTATEKKGWVAFVAAHPNENLYDAHNPSTPVKSIHWEAKPKDGYAADATSGTLSFTAPKWVDYVEDVKLGGTATDDYFFTIGTTPGVTYTISDSKTGTFVAPDVFKNANSNIAGKTLWYKVETNDASQYLIDPSIATKQIPITFKNAVGAVVVPALNPAKTESNNWAILTSTFTPNLTYTFSIPEKQLTSLSATELLNHLDDLYDSKTDQFNTLQYEISLTDPANYIWPKGYDPKTASGTITVTGLTKVVTSVITPQLSWAGSTEHASDNFDISTETQSVDYEFTVDDWTTHLSATQLKGINLYDSSAGAIKTLKYRAKPKASHKSTQPSWEGVVSTAGVTTYIIDSVEDSTLTAGGKTTDYTFTTPTKNVVYYFYDAHGSNEAKKLAEFKADHTNIYNTTNWSLDTVAFGVEPIAITNGITYKLKGITNTKNSTSTAGAKTINLTGITKVIDIDVPAPSHQGMTNSHTEDLSLLPQGLKDAVEYTYRMHGDTAYGAYPSSDFVINGVNTAVEWKATAKSGYEIVTGKKSDGVLPLLPSSLAIYEKDFVAPEISFTNTYSYVLKTGTATTPNVVYEFRIEGTNDWKTFDKFGNPNLFDKTNGTTKNIEWRATPAVTSTGTFFWADGNNQTIQKFPTKNIADKIDTQSVDKFLETVDAPTLVNASANSTDIDLTEPTIDSKYVTYTYQIDGNGKDLTLAELKDAYGKIDWDQVNANGAITWKATNKTGYVIAPNKGGGSIDTSKIKKIVNAATPAFTGSSVSTDEYSIETATHNGLTYYISINGGTKVKLADFLATTPLTSLFSIDNGLSDITWSVEADTAHNFALPANFKDTDKLAIPATLKKMVDKIINPTMTGTTTKDYNFTIDPKETPYVEFKYSLLPNDAANAKTITDFKTANLNIWDSSNDQNKTIYAYPVTKGNVGFASSANTSAITIDTSKLIKVVDVIAAPTLDATSANTKSYTLTATQKGVDFKYSTDGSTWEDYSTFIQKNLYHKDATGAWVVDTIHWQATAQADHQITAANTGTIDTSALHKFIESLPSISATGDTKAFTEVVTGTTDVPTIPGITYEYYLGSEKADTTKHYATLSDLIAAHPNLNLFDSARAKMETIGWSATLDAANYALAANISTEGTVGTDNLIKVLEINPNWVPKTGSGDDWTHWSLSVTSTPEWESLVNYVYSYDNPGATAADWSDYATFHAAHINLSPDGNAHQIIYKINIKDKQHYKFEISPLEQGSVILPFSTIITKLDAPVAELINGKASSTLVGMHNSTPDVTYTYSLDPNGPFQEWSKFTQSQYNLYNWETNDFKTLYWKAEATDAHTHSIAATITTGVSTPGTVELTNSAIPITKVLDDFVKPVLTATDSLTYGIAGAAGKPLTTGLTYKLVIGNDEDTPAELMAKKINIYDVISNTDKVVSWKVVAQDGYVLGSGVIDNGSPLSIPVGMKNVVDRITAPVFKNDGDSENWTITETNASSDVVFKYSIDNSKPYTLAELQSVLAVKFNNLWDNTTNRFSGLTWQVVLNNTSKYSFKTGMATTGPLDLPTDLVKVIDSVAKPTIPANSESNNYSLVEPTNNVKYEYSTDGSNWVSQTGLPGVLPNIYDENTGHLKLIHYRITPADNTFSLASRATPTTGEVDTSTVTKWFITSVQPVSINGTTTVNYGFTVPTKPGLVYTFSTDENGTFEDIASFRTHNPNLYSTTNGLKKVWWKAEASDAKHVIQSGVKTSAPIDISSLTRIVDVHVEPPKVDPNSSTNNWSMTAPTADWIKSFVYWTDNDTQERTLTDFHALYSNITDLKTKNVAIHYKALPASNYEFATQDLATGVFDFDDWKTVFETNIDLSKLTFEVTSDHKYKLVTTDPTVADISDILQIPSDIHLEFAWGDDPTNFIYTDAQGFNEVYKEFARKIEPNEFWDNSTQANGDKGAWKHGGSVTFKLVPNKSTDNVKALNGPLEFTIDFEAIKLKKVIPNYPITINDEQHNPGHDTHFEYVAKYTDKWHQDTNKVDIQLKVGTSSTDANGKITYTPSVSSVQADGSDSLLPILNSWIENRQNNVHITVNPFATLSQQEIDDLINSITPARLADVKADYPNLIATGETLASLKAKFKTLLLDAETAKQFFLLVNDIWDGANWRIKEIEIKPVAESDEFVLVDDDSRVVWDENSISIAKVTDDSELIELLKETINPADQVGSLHDSVIWGDVAKVQELIDKAKSQNLLIRLASYNDGEQPVWYDLKDLNDPEDFFNKVKGVSKVHIERRLSAQIISTATDKATGKLVKLTHEEVMNITSDSKVQKVKTRVTSQDYKTESIRITGHTNNSQHPIEIDESIVKENYLLVSYSIPNFPNQWFTKEELLKKIAELASDKKTDGTPQVPQYVYGKDITAKIDVKPDWKEKYSLGAIITGPIDYSNLYTDRDVSHWKTSKTDANGNPIYANYVEALEKDITLDGTPNAKKGTTDPSANNKSIYIALDNSILTDTDFTNNFGIQYRINNGTKTGEWALFTPGIKDLPLDPDKNVLADHEAGKYMAVNMNDHDDIQFRIIPIATAGNPGDVVITDKDANLTEEQIFHRTRILISDWNQKGEGTIVKRDTTKLLSIGENELVKAINNNQNLTMNNAAQNNTWLAPFLALVTSNPRYENIEDVKFDPGLFFGGKLIDFSVEKQVDDAVLNGYLPAPVKDENGNVITPGFKETIALAIQKLTNGSDWDANGKAIVPNIAIAAELFGRIDNPKNQAVLSKIYTMDNTNRGNSFFNRDLLQSNVSSFEISQIGDHTYAPDQYGKSFSLSNTIFFGTNAIRFNVREDSTTNTNEIVDAYLVAEDKNTPERIAKIHVSTLYTLSQMSLVLELQNGQVVSLQKSIDGSSKEENIKFARLQPHGATQDSFDDVVKSGANWIYASESLIAKNVQNVMTPGYQSPEAIKDVALNQKTLVKTIKQWTANSTELDANSKANQIPFDATLFDNVDPSLPVVPDPNNPHPRDKVIVLTSIQPDPSVLGTSPAQDIYENAKGDLSAIFGPNVKPSIATVPQNALGSNQNSLPSVVNFDTTAHFSDPSNYKEQQLFETKAQDDEQKQRYVGYMVVVDSPNAKGEVHYRWIKQSVKQTTGDSETLFVAEKPKNNSIPAWGIALAAIGSAIATGGLGYLIYNKYITKKASKSKRSRASIRKPKLKK